MATRLDEAPRVARGLYGFEQYTDGNWWVLSNGEDYPSEHDTQRVRESAKAWARRHGYRLASRKVDDESIALQFIADQVPAA